MSVTLFLNLFEHQTLVALDDLPEETREDIVMWLLEELPIVSKNGWDAYDLRANLFDLVDPPKVPLFKVNPNAVLAHPDRGVSTSVVQKYAAMPGDPPPIVLDGKKLLEGGHRLMAARLNRRPWIMAVDIAFLIRMDWKRWMAGDSNVHPNRT